MEVPTNAKTEYIVITLPFVEGNLLLSDYDKEKQFSDTGCLCCDSYYAKCDGNCLPKCVVIYLTCTKCSLMMLCFLAYLTLLN